MGWTRLRMLALFATPATVMACNAIIGTRDVFFENGTSEDDLTNDSGAKLDASTNEASPCGVDTSTNPQNCGACGHDCSSGKCAAGVCTLVDNLTGPGSLAVRNGFVYLGLSGDPTGIAKCPTNGCSSNGATRLEPSGTEMVPSRIVVDDAYAYVADSYSFNPGGILRVGLDGAGFTRLVLDGGMPRSRDLAQDSTTLFWTTFDSPEIVRYCAKSGCAGAGIKTITGTESASRIVIGADGSLVWAVDETAIKRCSSATACVSQTFPDFSGSVRDLVGAGNTVFWSTTEGQILSCPVTGCTVTNPVISNQGLISGLAAQGTSLYWATIPTDGDDNPVNEQGVIHACTLPDCAATAHDVATSLKAPTDLVIDGPSLYWTNQGLFERSNGIGSVAKIPR